MGVGLSREARGALLVERERLAGLVLLEPVAAQLLDNVAPVRGEPHRVPPLAETRLDPVPIERLGRLHAPLVDAAGLDPLDAAFVLSQTVPNIISIDFDGRWVICFIWGNGAAFIDRAFCVSPFFFSS